MDTEMTQGLELARKTARWMAIGIVPSQGNAQRAREALNDLHATYDEVRAPLALRLASGIEMGLAPSVEMCNAAVAEIDQAVDAMHEISRQTQRERQR